MVHITYRHAQLDEDGVQSTLEERVIIREYHFYISDDRSHSAHFVQHCFHHHDRWMLDHGITCTQRWIWSDGCGAQFKSARQFYWFYTWHCRTGVQVLWSFFETGHGKGEHDGAGACIKRALRRHQLRHDSERFRDARQVVDWCTDHMSTSAISSFPTRDARDVRRFFWCIEAGDIDTTGLDCATVDGTLKLHSIRSSSYCDPTIFTRKYACFCERCVDGGWQSCQNREWSDAWFEKVLTPLQVRQDGPLADMIAIGDGQRSVDHDSLTDYLQEGDVFAVIASENNEEHVDYYLLRCTRAKCTLTADVTDDYGHLFERHSVVVYGRYYAQIATRGGAIVFSQYEWEKEAIMYSHLVLGVKLDLRRVHSKKTTAPRWTLSHSDHEGILDTLRHREDPI